MAVDVAANAVTCDALDGCRKVLWRHIQSFGIVGYLALGAAYTRRKHIHQLLHDVGCSVAVRSCSIALCVRLEDVVHHRKTEATHKFAVEQQMTVA